MSTSTLSAVFDAFTFHDQEGLPLAFAMSAAKEHGFRVNLAAFACDAFAAGWTDERVRQTLESAACDANERFRWEEFRGKLAQLFALAGAEFDNPECWRAMKRRLVETSSPIVRDSGKANG